MGFTHLPGTLRARHPPCQGSQAARHLAQAHSAGERSCGPLAEHRPTRRYEIPASDLASRWAVTVDLRKHPTGAACFRPPVGACWRAGEPILVLDLGDG